MLPLNKIQAAITLFKKSAKSIKSVISRRRVAYKNTKIGSPRITVDKITLEHPQQIIQCDFQFYSFALVISEKCEFNVQLNFVWFDVKLETETKYVPF